MDQIDRKDLAQRHIARQKAYDDLREESGKRLSQIALQYRGTLTNLALAFAAISAGSMATLGFTIPKSNSLIVCGSMLFLYLAALAFIYLLRAHRYESKSLLRTRSRQLSAYKEILVSFDNAMASKLPLEEYLQKETEFEKKSLDEYVERNHVDDIVEDNSEIYFGLGATTATIILMAGYLIPLVSSVY